MSPRLEWRKSAGRFDRRAGPWVRRKQISRVLGPPDPGAIAELVDHRGETLGYGLYSPESAIILRLLGQRPPAADWLERRLDAAIAGRAAMGLGAGANASTTGYREVNSEGDGLPGLVVDRFADWRVAQITTAPMAARVEALVAHLGPRPGDDLRGLIVLAPESAATREGFDLPLRVVGEDAPSELRWRERGLSMAAPAPPAQKTGAYHDQRDNRAHFATLLGGEAIDPELPVLDLGCHVGGFALAAARAGRRVVAVDQSRDALAHARKNAAANGLQDRVEFVSADMFGALDHDALAGPFAAAVFDPPKIASSRRDLDRATGAMARTMTTLLSRLAPAGLLAACSCSHHLGGDALDRALWSAAERSGRACTRVASWGPGGDHPVWPGHVEGEYLRVAVYQRRWDS